MMRIKSLFSVVLLCNGYFAMAQNVSAAGPVPVLSLEMLGKLEFASNDDDTVSTDALPTGFNWAAESRKIKGYKNMALNPRKQDDNGRDLIPEMTAELTQKVYLENIPDKD